jgi:hypothetical protein
MPAAWQATGTLLGSTGANISPVWPSHAAGDAGIVLASSRVTTETCTTPAGYALIRGPIDTTAWRTYVFFKYAATAAEANVSLAWSAAVGEKYGQVHTLRGADTLGAHPFADNILSADTVDTIASTGVTSTLPNQLIIVVGIGSDNASASMTSVAGTDPAAYSQRSYTTIATGADATGWFFDAARTTAGATGTVTQDFNSTMPAAGVFVAAVLNPPVPPLTTVAGMRS